MREIKFRAWFRENNEMIYSGVMPDFRFWKCAAYDDTTPIMQFTGLKYKNGKEIYEGDIVKHHNGIKVVEYHEESVSFQMDLYDHVLDQEVCNYDDVDVIGNIYENPELLE